MSKKLRPLKAIRAKCLDCSCFQPKEVKLCPVTDCTLFLYRDGHNPAREGVGPRPGKIAPKSLREFSKNAKERPLNG